MSLSEELLYDLARLPHEEALSYFRQTVLGQNNVEETTETRATILTPNLDYAPGTKRHFTRMMQTITKAAPGKHKNNAQALKAVRELREWLEDQEKRIIRLSE